LSPLVRGTALLCLLALAACGGGGGDSTGGGGGGGGGGTPPPVASVTVSGTVTYDRVPFSSAVNGGLDFANVQAAPVRGATVQAVAAGGATVLASTTTDANGQYSLSVAGNTDLFVRVRAELVRTGTPSWTVTVRDNTAADALYTLDGSLFNSGTANSTRNLAARSGWTAGAGYTGTRAAAPFSILDSVYEAQQLVLGADANVQFPELRLLWSPGNVPCDPGANGFCSGTSVALARGEIGTTFFSPGGPDRIYVLGAVNNDTDEFDQHVIAHEWGHYYQDNFSRDDSLGGDHAPDQRLDLRVAFSEGWGNAFAGMVRGSPVYRDSFGASQASDFRIDVEVNNNPNAGWFSEGSIQSIIWDLYDSSNEAGDTVSMGFAPIHGIMRARVRTTTAFSSIYPLLEGLRIARPADVAGLNALTSAQLIAIASSDFGAGETNAGLDARNLPIYRPIASGQTFEVCSTLPTALGVYNKLGNRRFLRIDTSAVGTATIRATYGGANGTAPTDPYLVLYAAGVERARAESADNGAKTLTVTGLDAGTYVLEVYEFSNIDPSATARGTTCFNVSFTLS
jgi:hypothetical protein